MRVLWALVDVSRLFSKFRMTTILEQRNYIQTLTVHTLCFECFKLFDFIWALIPSTVHFETVWMGEVKGNSISTCFLLPRPAAISIGIAPHCQETQEQERNLIRCIKAIQEKKKKEWHRHIYNNNNNNIAFFPKQVGVG